MIAMTDNPIDLLFAAALTVPLLVVAVCYLAIWAEERSGSASTTSGGRTAAPSGVADGLPGPTSLQRDGDPPVASGQPPTA